MQSLTSTGFQNKSTNTSPYTFNEACCPSLFGPLHGLGNEPGDTVIKSIPESLGTVSYLVIETGANTVGLIYQSLYQSLRMYGLLSTHDITLAIALEYSKVGRWSVV